MAVVYVFVCAASSHSIYLDICTKRCGLINFLLSFGLIQNEHDKIKELSQQLAIEKKRAASYKRQLELVFEHIEEHNKHLSNNIQDIVNSVKEMESQEHWNVTQLETSRGKRKPS